MATIQTRDEIRDRILKRIGRENDTTASALAEELIEQAVREIEGLHSFPWTRDRKTINLTSGDNTYDLDADLIYAHPYTAKIVKTPVSGNASYEEMIPVSWERFEEFFLVPAEEGKPRYFTYSGLGTGTQFEIEVYPTPDGTYDVLLLGHFYTDTSAWTGSSTNWLSIHAPLAIVELVVYYLFLHYGEPQRAGEAYEVYQELVYGRDGIVTKAKKQDWNRRPLRLKHYTEYVEGTRKTVYGG